MADAFSLSQPSMHSWLYKNSAFADCAISVHFLSEGGVTTLDGPFHAALLCSSCEYLRSSVRFQIQQTPRNRRLFSSVPGSQNASNITNVTSAKTQNTTCTRPYDFIVNVDLRSESLLPALNSAIHYTYKASFIEDDTFGFDALLDILEVSDGLQAMSVSAAALARWRSLSTDLLDSVTAAKHIVSPFADNGSIWGGLVLPDCVEAFLRHVHGASCADKSAVMRPVLGDVQQVINRPHLFALLCELRPDEVLQWLLDSELRSNDEETVLYALGSYVRVRERRLLSLPSSIMFRFVAEGIRWSNIRQLYAELILPNTDWLQGPELQGLVQDKPKLKLSSRPVSQYSAAARELTMMFSMVSLANGLACARSALAKGTHRASILTGTSFVEGGLLHQMHLTAVRLPEVEFVNKFDTGHGVDAAVALSTQSSSSPLNMSRYATRYFLGVVVTGTPNSRSTIAHSLGGRVRCKGTLTYTLRSGQVLLRPFDRVADLGSLGAGIWCPFHGDSTFSTPGASLLEPNAWSHVFIEAGPEVRLTVRSLEVELPAEAEADMAACSNC